MISDRQCHLDSEQPAGHTIDFRISSRCSCRGKDCRAHTPARGGKAENILKQGGCSDVRGRPIVRLLERSGRGLRVYSSGEGDEGDVLGGGDKYLPGDANPA